MPPESAPIDQVDPAAASALHRLLVVHRLQPDLPASVDLRAFDRIEVCGPEEPARSLARAMICSATAFHSPEHLVVAVLTTEQNLAHWDWVKWLPHAQSAQQSDAVGPRRMVSTSLDELAAMLPADLSERPRFGADERPATPHILLVIDGAELPPGNHIVPPDGVHGVTVLDLPVRWDELEDATRLRLQFEARRPSSSTAATRSRRCGCATRRSGPRSTSARWPPPRRSRGGSRRCTPSAACVESTRRPRPPATPTSWSCSRSATCTASTPTRPGSSGPRATGCGCRSASATAAPSCTSTSRSPPSRAWARTAW